MSGFAADRASGASAVAEAFLGELERWTAVDRSTDSTGFQASLLRFLRDAQAAQPSMALIHQLSARALDVATTGVRRGDKVVDLRGHLVQSCRTEREDLAAARAGVARTAAGLIERRGGWIGSTSSSTTCGRRSSGAKRSPARRKPGCGWRLVSGASPRSAAMPRKAGTGSSGCLHAPTAVRPPCCARTP